MDLKEVLWNLELALEYIKYKVGEAIANIGLRIMGSDPKEFWERYNEMGWENHFFYDFFSDFVNKEQYYRGYLVAYSLRGVRVVEFVDDLWEAKMLKKKEGVNLYRVMRVTLEDVYHYAMPDSTLDDTE